MTRTRSFTRVCLPGGRLPQKFDAVQNARSCPRLPRGVAALLGADRDEDGGVFLPEGLEGDVLADAAVIDEP